MLHARRQLHYAPSSYSNLHLVPRTTRPAPRGPDGSSYRFGVLHSTGRGPVLSRNRLFTGSPLLHISKKRSQHSQGMYRFPKTLVRLQAFGKPDFTLLRVSFVKKQRKENLSVQFFRISQFYKNLNKRRSMKFIPYLLLGEVILSDTFRAYYSTQRRVTHKHAQTHKYKL